MPSLYESTAQPGDVSSNDFTTLYNASGLTVPNAGAGTATGNLNVSGNLTVQGTSNLIGAVTIGNTLSTPNYTFPLPDGSTDQVLVTDGNGNLYWTDVTAIPGAAYTISATPVAGGANLTLEDSAGGTDSVKFAGGTNITVTRTSANVITISTEADNIPDGTAQGQLLYWDGSAWTASDNIEYTTATARPAFINNAPSSIAAAEFLKRNATLTDGQTTGILTGIIDGADARTYVHRLLSEYDNAGNPAFRIQADPAGTFTGSTVYAQLYLDNDQLGLYGSELLFLRNATGAPTQNVTIGVNRGSSPDATLVWNETADRWEVSNDLYVQGNYRQDGDTLSINGDATAVDSYLYFKGNSEYLKWNDTDQRFEFSDQIYNTLANRPAAVFERRVVAGEVSPGETKGPIRLLERVTDATSNATDDGGPAVIFGRTYGTSGGSEQLFASMASSWNGTTNTANLLFAWSTDNFTETSPGVFPNTYTLLNLGSNIAKFQNNSIYVDYSVAGAGRVGINTANPTNALDVVGNSTISGSLAVDVNTLFVDANTNNVGIGTNVPGYKLDVQGDINATGDIITSGVKIDLATPVRQGQILSITNEATPTISNSSDVTFLNNTYRPTFVAKSGTSGRVQTSATFLNNTGAVAYGQGDGSGILMGVDSDSQARRFIGSFNTAYDTTGNHQVRISTSTNDFTTRNATSITGGNTLVFGSAHGYTAGNKIVYVTPTQNGLVQNTYYYVLATGLTTTQLQLSLTQGGTAVTLSNGTGLTLGFQTSTRVLVVDSNQLDLNGPTINLNANGSGVPEVNGAIVLNRGTTGGNATLNYQIATDRWYFDNGDGQQHPMAINIDDLADVVITPPTASGQFLYNDGSNWVNSSTVNWTNTAYRSTFQSSGLVPGRAYTALGAVNNTGATAYGDGDGSGMLIGVKDDTLSAPKYIASMTAANYAGAGGNEVRMSTSSNNFVVNTATSITGGNTLVFSAAHGFTAGTPIQYLTQTANGLTQDAIYYVLATGLTTTQCQISTTAGGTAVALTNGTGLSLAFYNLNNTRRLIVADKNTVKLNGSTLILNANNTGVAATDASLIVERGSSGTDASLSWSESAGTWFVNGSFVSETSIGTNGNNFWFNNDDGAAADAFVNVKRGASPDVNIKWNEATTRWQTTTDGTNYLNIPNQNLDTTDDVNFSSVIVDGQATLNTQSTTTTSTTTVNISGTTRMSQKVLINITDTVTGEVHSVEAMAMRKGTTAYLTTYAEMYSLTPLATFSANVVSGFLRILATPASANSTTFSVVRISLD